MALIKLFPFPLPRGAAPPTDPRRGFTLLEMAIALVILTIAFSGFALLFVMNSRSYDLTNEDSLAIHSLRETAEKMRGAPFSQVAAYQGYNYEIAEINAKVNVTVFLNETDTSPDAQKLGLPRDLNGDGTATSINVADTYLLLPVKIEVTWSNVRGSQSKALYVLLAQETN